MSRSASPPPPAPPPSIVVEALYEVLRRQRADFHSDALDAALEVEPGGSAALALWNVAPPPFQSAFGSYIALIFRLMADPIPPGLDADQLYALEQRRRRLHTRAAQLLQHWLHDMRVIAAPDDPKRLHGRLMQVLEEVANEVYLRTSEP